MLNPSHVFKLWICATENVVALICSEFKESRPRGGGGGLGGPGGSTEYTSEGTVSSGVRLNTHSRLFSSFSCLSLCIMKPQGGSWGSLLTLACP